MKECLCRYCGEAPVNRPRGLCWGCFYRPGVRQLFPTLSKFGRRGVADFYGRGSFGEPTDALPGTPEKVEVMVERARLGQQIFHPDDAELDVDHHPLRLVG